MSLFTEKQDLLAVLDWMICQSEIDPGALFLFGGSMGGLVTVLAAPEVRQKIRGLVLLFPALCIPDNWNQRFPRNEDIPETLHFWDLMLGRVFFETLRGLDPFRLLSDLDLPVLMLHGDQDPIVPLAYSQRALTLFPHAQLAVFPGEAHGFTPAADADVFRRLLAFVQTHA